MNKPMLLLPNGDQTANQMLERRLKARKVVDHLFTLPRPQRWIAARNVWVALHPLNAMAHREAVSEVKLAKASAVDKKYGRSKAAMGLAPDQKSNKNTSTRLVAIFPEPEGMGGLKDFLKRVDPHFLALPNGKDYRLNWRKVYKAFPEYTVPEEIDYWDGSR